MNYFIDDANERAMTRVRGLRELADLAMPICQAASEFDKKVFNKRFIDRVRELTNGRARVSNTGYSIQITGYIVPSASETATLMTVSLLKLQDGKRISAQLFSDSTIECKHALLKRADDLEEYVEKAPDVREHYETLYRELEEYLDSIPSDVHDIYRIPYRLRTT